MIISNTKSAAEKIASHASDSELTDYLDEMSRNNSLLIFITDTEGEIIYSADEYKKGHKGFEGEPKHAKRAAEGIKKRSCHTGRCLTASVSFCRRFRLRTAARIIRIQLLILTALSVAVGFVLAWFMSRSFSRPISQLNAKAHTLGENAEKHDFREGLLLGARRA